MSYRAHVAHKNVLSVTATAMKKDILEQLLEDLRSISCKVLMVEPAYAGVARAFASMNLFQSAKTNGLVVLQSDGSVNLTFTANGVVYLSRDFLLGGTGEEDKKHFFEELKASIDYFYKLTGGEAVQKIFLAGHGDLKLWVEYFEQAFNYTLRFDLAKFPAETNIPADVMGSVLVAFGLAIRSIGYKSPIGEIELLPAQERCSKPEKFFGILAAIAGAIFLVFLIVRAAILQPTIFGLQAQNDKIFGEGSGVDPAVAVRTEADLLAERDALAGRIKDLDDFAKAGVSPSELLRAIAQGIPKSISVEFISIEDAVSRGKSSGKGAKRLNLSGICFLGSSEQEAATVNSWVKSLSEKKIFSNVFSEIRLEDIRRANAGNRSFARFKIVCE
jgi:hypothetical protein